MVWLVNFKKLHGLVFLLKIRSTSLTKTKDRESACKCTIATVVKADSTGFIPGLL
jgi:hypothetical protein